MSLVKLFRKAAYNTLCIPWNFCLAAQFNRKKEVYRLMEKYGDNIRNDTKEQPLDCALWHTAQYPNRKKMISYLVEQGADINYQDDYWKRTPLMQAAVNGKMNNYEKLKELGADPSIKDKNGHTAEDILKQTEQTNERRRDEDGNLMTSPSQMAQAHNIFNPLL